MLPLFHFVALFQSYLCFSPDAWDYESRERKKMEKKESFQLFFVQHKKRKFNCKLFGFFFPETSLLLVSTVIYFTRTTLFHAANRLLCNFLYIFVSLFWLWSHKQISFFHETFFFLSAFEQFLNLWLAFLFTRFSWIHSHRPNCLLFSAPVDSWNQFLIAFLLSTPKWGFSFQ